MAAARKIHPLRLGELVAEGKTCTEIARELGVNKASVSRAIKRLGSAVTKDIMLRAAGRLVSHRFDAAAQLTEINEAILREFRVIGAGLEEMETKADRGPAQNAQIMHAQELRRQIETALQIAESLYNVEEAARFQKLVLEELGAASPEMRARIIARLAQARALIPTGAYECSGIGPGSGWLPFARESVQPKAGDGY